MFDANDRINDINKAEWDRLRGEGYGLDYERTLFLWNVMVDTCYSDYENLAGYMVAILDEYAGKRTRSLVRMVQAFENIDDESIWNKIGGKSVVLLDRVDRRRHSRILRLVDETLERTGRECLSEGTFRSILRDVLGTPAYRDTLTEKRTRRNVLTYYDQCLIFQRAFHALIQKGKITQGDLPPDVRPLVAGAEGARKRAA